MPVSFKADPTFLEPADLVHLPRIDGSRSVLFVWRDLAQVTIVEMLPYLMKESCTANRGYLIHHLEKAGLVLWNCTRLLRVGPQGVTIVRNVSPTVPSPTVTWSPVLPDNVKNPLARPIRVREQEVALEADLVVLAVGLEPDDGLYEACVRGRVAAEIHNIGDSFTPGSIFEATKAGYALGRSL